MPQPFHAKPPFYGPAWPATAATNANVAPEPIPLSVAASLARKKKPSVFAQIGSNPVALAAFRAELEIIKKQARERKDY
jgi:hypothetical protein